MIASRQNSLIKAIRKLHARKERRVRNEFLLEGTNLMAAAVAEDYPLSVVCWTQAWTSSHPELTTAIELSAHETHWVSTDILSYLATTITPDGVIATAKRRPMTPPTENHNGLTLILDAVQDPGNVGTIIRTAAAVGVTRLSVSADSVDLTHPKILRSTAGAWFQLPMNEHNDSLQYLNECKNAGVQVVAAVPRAENPFWEIDYLRPTALLFGNEGAGLPSALIALADQMIAIPTRSAVESLNVSVAAAIVLYEYYRQKMLLPAGG